MTMVIAIPTSVLVFTWIATMFKGRIRFTTPMLWFLGFVGTFAIGGMTGVMLAQPPADFQLHNSLFLVAHFHTMVIGGVLWGIFAGISYWFPKMTGFRLNERIGRYAFWFWLIGFWMAFGPLYVLGIMGATRRLDHYTNTSWRPFFIVALLGGITIMLAIVLQIIQIVASFIQKRQLADNTGDPWDGRSLEWSTPSPAPFYNFINIPQVTTRDAFWEMKRQGIPKPVYEDIVMPKNIASGIYIAGLAFLLGFGFIWGITWLIVASAIGIVVCVILRTFNEDTEYVLTAAEVEKLEQDRRHKVLDRLRHADTYKEADMGLREFIKVALGWALDFVRNRRWRTI
jgi:cytochrome o ubiquinol oxidase subunit 1